MRDLILPERRPLLLSEMDAALRRAEREAGSGDPEDVRRHFQQHVRAGREPQEFFAKELEGYHKAHDEWRAAQRAHVQTSLGTPEWERTRSHRNDAWDSMGERGRALAAKAHATDHPVGQYLDWRGPKERIATSDIHMALHHVSHNPKSQPPHGYGATVRYGDEEKHLTNADEKSAQHLEHALRAHGLGSNMERSKRDPHLVVLGRRKSG